MKYLSVQEVAGQLGVSDKTVRKLIRSGKLRAVKVGALYRVAEQSVASYLAASECRTEPDERAARRQKARRVPVGPYRYFPPPTTL